jgi:hypothetical protein
MLRVEGVIRVPYLYLKIKVGRDGILIYFIFCTYERSHFATNFSAEYKALYGQPLNLATGGKYLVDNKYGMQLLNEFVFGVSCWLVKIKSSQKLKTNTFELNFLR